MSKILTLLIIAVAHMATAQDNDPLRIGIIGLTHSHVHWILGRPDDGDIEVVGIVEPNRELAKRFSDQHGYSMDLVFNTMDEMIQKTKPQVVTAFGSIFEHLEVVKTCAPLGIHVMVEKPLAVSLEHAQKMKELADNHGIYLLTNYETTWYATNHETFDLVKEGAVGDLRKIVVHDGHMGPKEIGVNDEFLEWLTDPEENGAGALMDFGCYGANLITWLMKGDRPISVTALTQQIKPDIYPQVDDEATILLEYPKTQGIIQASWNWPFSRKDMEVYGRTGTIFSDNRNQMRIRREGEENEQIINFGEREPPFNDPFAFFEAVINEKIEMDPYDLSSLENNMIVMEILEAAKESAKTGKRVYLNR